MNREPFLERHKAAIERSVLAAEGLLVGLFLVPALQACALGPIAYSNAVLLALAANPAWLFAMAWATGSYGGAKTPLKRFVVWGFAALLAYPGYLVTAIALSGGESPFLALAVSQAFVAAPMGLVCGLLWTRRP